MHTITKIYIAIYIHIIFVTTIKNNYIQRVNQSVCQISYHLPQIRMQPLSAWVTQNTHTPHTDTRRSNFLSTIGNTSESSSKSKLFLFHFDFYIAHAAAHWYRFVSNYRNRIEFVSKTQTEKIRKQI